MSKATFVHYRNAAFWVHDVAGGIFLKYLIDAAASYASQENSSWLQDCIELWCFNAVISDGGIHLDEQWTDDQVQIVVGLMEEACIALEEKAAVAADEMEAWNIFEGRGVFALGDHQFPTAPVVELGHAIRALLVGTLLTAPE